MRHYPDPVYDPGNPPELKVSERENENEPCDEEFETVFEKENERRKRE